jgi:phosphonate transport system substrate-binding protein
MTEFGSALRRIWTETASMEESAGRIVKYLYKMLFSGLAVGKEEGAGSNEGELLMVGKVSAFFLILLAVVLPADAATSSYGIAVVPTAPTVALHTQWAPFLERLTEKTGVRFRLQLFENMTEFERAIGAGSYDFIFASPIQTVVARQAHRYVPLVRGGAAKGIGLFVRSDSDVRTIDDLSGKTISFVGNKNVCSVLIRHLLASREQPLSFASNYAGSTRNVIKTVLLGKTAAGAVFVPELEREPAENREQLRAVIETAKIPPHPLSAHPRVPRPVREKIRKAVLALAAERDGVELLNAVMLAAPVAADYRRDYLPLEIIDIKGLTDWGK